MADIKEGDAVKHMNGRGPKMTVDSILMHNGEPTAKCSWSDEKGVPRQRLIGLHQIEHWTPPVGSTSEKGG